MSKKKLKRRVRKLKRHEMDRRLRDVERALARVAVVGPATVARAVVPHMTRFDAAPPADASIWSEPSPTPAPAPFQPAAFAEGLKIVLAPGLEPTSAGGPIWPVESPSVPAPGRKHRLVCDDSPAPVHCSECWATLEEIQDGLSPVCMGSPVGFADLAAVMMSSEVQP